MNTIFAKKVGMAGKFTPERKRVGVTILEVVPTKVVDGRTKEKHGYNALRVKLEIRNLKFKIREIRTDEKIEPGTEIKVTDILKPGDVINVTGVSKGHGFTGAVKRYGFAGGPRTHGQSDRERAPGSSGSTTTPGRVFRGKRRAGRMGNDKVMIKNLKVIDVDGEKRLIAVIGAVPGARTGLLRVTKL